MPFQSEKQRRWMWKNKPDMAKKWTDEHGSTPIKAKKGKYQKFEHPQHNLTPIEHMEEKVSSKERIERMLDERKAKKESKKKLVRAQEGQLIREKTRGTGAAVKGTDHYVMQGMDAAQEGKLIQVPTRGTGQAVKGTDHYVMEGMDAAKEGKIIKAKKGSYLTTGLKGYDVKKISSKTSEKLFDLYKHRERGGFKKAKDYKKYLTSLGKMQKTSLSGTSTTLPPKTARLLTNLKFAYKQTPKAKALSVLKKVGKRTAIGKAVLAATAVAGAYEAGKKKLFTKDKKKVTKKSIGGETVVMKSGGGYIDELL